MSRVPVRIVALALFALAGCILGPSSSSTTSTSTGTTTTTTTTSAATTSATGSGCDAQQGCMACDQCAEQGVCGTKAQTCNANASCVGMAQCIQLCGTTADCFTQCQAQNPNGVTEYNSLITCVYCTACPTQCAGFGKCTAG